MSTDERTQAELASAWDQVAARMELYPPFYAFVADALQQVSLPLDTRIVDVGCGTGRLLSVLAERGYRNLTGVDFSAQAVEITRQRLPAATVFTHNIVEQPLPAIWPAIFLTEVIEHLTDPRQALKNLYHSLEPGGYLFLSFPNRLAYEPWLYLRGLRHLVGWWPWLRQWVMWFTLPYELRTDQPLDHAYSPGDVAGFIQGAGLRLVRQRGMRLLPMFRISGLDFTEAIVARLERATQGWPVQRWYYRSMFICQK